ncbi:MAG: hypothetical protein IPN04_01770 [Rhodoferax sp.]|nr:hypothetical protein [Rhodoferax sp.]
MERALAFDEFDSHDGRELAVLGNSSLSLLDVPSYVIKSQKVIANECDHTCISMYPRLVASGHGKTLIASSAGVADSEGNQQWRLNSEGFTRLIPIKLHDKEPTYVSYQNMERITRHDVNGKMVWNANIPAYDVGVYKTKDGEQLPFAIVGKRNSSELNIFDIEGQFKTKFLMPFTAGNVESINWPSPGHLLAGSGAMISVFSVDGTEVFKHVIQNTSFRPYHGPYGVSVRFDNNKEPYLAVISHGSSG